MPRWTDQRSQVPGPPRSGWAAWSGACSTGTRMPLNSTGGWAPSSLCSTRVYTRQLTIMKKSIVGIQGISVYSGKVASSHDKLSSGLGCIITNVTSDGHSGPSTDMLATTRNTSCKHHRDRRHDAKHGGVGLRVVMSRVNVAQQRLHMIIMVPISLSRALWS